MSAVRSVGGKVIGSAALGRRRAAAVMLEVTGGDAATATPAAEVLLARIGHLERAVASRTVIGQAEGILMERHGVSAQEAFELLRVTPQHLNRKLRDVAADLVATRTEAGTEESVTAQQRRHGSPGDLARFGLSVESRLGPVAAGDAGMAAMETLRTRQPGQATTPAGPTSQLSPPFGAGASTVARPRLSRLESREEGVSLDVSVSSRVSAQAKGSRNGRVYVP